MLFLDDIKVEFESQGFKGTHIGISPDKDKSVLFLESVRSTQTVRCPYCGGNVYIYENGQVKLKDIPIQRGTTHIWIFFIHRYQCNCCHETFTEEIPFKYPGTRITYRAANWIKGFLQQKISIKAIQELTGIHWDTIRKVQREIMDEAIWEREKMLREKGYKPRIHAVDEFAIHKGYSYATCVMDLEQGDILWVGKGRAMKDFEKFFEEVPSDSLSAVIAVAMDMNASYNKLVTKHGLYMIGFICSRNLAEMFSALFIWMKLAGFNNKIKVAKRIGYGYRDDDFFFTLIRYLSIPSVRSPSHKKS